MAKKKRKRSSSSTNEPPRKRHEWPNNPHIPSTIKAMLGDDSEVLKLSAFIAKYAPSLPSFQFGEGEGDIAMKADYDRICRTYISPFTKNLKPLLSLKSPTRSESLNDLVDHAISSLVQRKSRNWALRNVMDQGYSVHSEKSSFRMCPNMRHGVVCTQVNDNVNFMKNSTYAQLLHRLIGDEMMRILMLHTNVFVPVGEESKRNFILVCGMSARPKNQQTDTIFKKNPAFTPNKLISRQGLYYSNAFVPKVGLPSNHVLHMNDPTKLLNTIFHIRDNNKKQRRKRWARLRESGIDVCRDILKQHRKCDYHRLLERHCPLPTFCKKRDYGIELSKVGAAHTPQDAVTAFVKNIVTKVFEFQTVWGSKRNLSVVLGICNTFCRLRKGEGFPYKELVGGIRVTDMLWLWGPQGSAKKRTRSDHDAARLLLQSLMQWMVSSFLIPLLRSIFYITDSEMSGKRLLYYRKPVWSIFRALSIKKLTSSQYKEVSFHEASELLKKQQLGLSTLKLLPKATGVRPLAMLSRRDFLEKVSRPDTKRLQCLPSNNAILANALNVLRREYEYDPEPFGSGLLGIHRIYPILKDLLQTFGSQGAAGIEKLHFVSVDIEKCYDRIDQEHLLLILERILTMDQYLIQSHDVIHPFKSSSRKSHRKRVQKVGPIEQFRTFHETAQALSKEYHGSVFVDGPGCQVVKRTDILQLLHEHLRRNLVAIPARYKKRYFMQVSGIPQGSLVSSFLCNYYYGHVEAQLLGSLKREKQNARRKLALVRIIDDFLMISSDETPALYFYEQMKRGMSELGVSINEKKTTTTLDISPENPGRGVGLVPRCGRLFFPWCGLLIDTETCECRIDYARFADGNSTNNMRIQRNQVGKQLAEAMKAYIRPRALPILFDRSINSFEVIVINFTQMLLFAATRAQQYFKNVICVSSNHSFIENSISATILFARNLIADRLRQSRKTGRTVCILNKNDAMYLGCHSFKIILNDILQATPLPMLENYNKTVTPFLSRTAARATRDFIDMLSIKDK